LVFPPLDLPVSTSLWNSVYDFYSVMGLISGGVTFGAMLYIMYRYRSKGDSLPPVEKQKEVRDSKKGPAVVVGLMAVVLILVGMQTLVAFPVTQTAPNAVSSPFGSCEVSKTTPSLVFHKVPNPGGNLNICVTGRQFFWSFTYPDNKTATELVVPVGRVVVLNVSSIDVYHQFGIPSFRTKTDAIPGRYNAIWIQPTEVGNFTVQCFELCGVGHATMITSLVVLSNSSFTRWYAAQGGAPSG
jgi:cytochrome c oxidase subunit II